MVALAAFVIALVFLFCTESGENPQATPENYEKITMGMTLAEVETILGTGQEIPPEGFKMGKALSGNSGIAFIGVFSTGSQPLACFGSGVIPGITHSINRAPVSQPGGDSLFSEMNVKSFAPSES